MKKSHEAQIGSGETPCFDGRTMMLPGPQRTEFESVVADGGRTASGIYLVNALVQALPLTEAAAEAARAAAEAGDPPILAVRADFPLDGLLDKTAGHVTDGPQLRRLAALMLAEELPEGYNSV
ncbi:MAG TPA: hypothetical protein VHA37_09890 [Candidatus Saccharimonadales bacterium]|nr:hypothetical protein [Candidatus Saccharimonadales bacterium]